jgi:hypothetical protein
MANKETISRNRANKRKSYKYAAAGEAFGRASVHNTSRVTKRILERRAKKEKQIQQRQERV